MLTSEEKIDNIESVVVSMSNDFKTHIKIEELTSKALNTNVERLSAEITEQRIHFDNTMSRLDITLKQEYATKAQIQSLRDETVLEQTRIRNTQIEAAKADILNRIRNYTAMISGTILLIVAILSYIVGLK